MEQDDTRYRGRSRPGYIVLDGDPAPPKRGHSSPPLFGPCLLWPNGWMDQDTTWYEGGPRPRRHCVRWGRSSSHGKGHNNSPLKMAPSHGGNFEDGAAHLVCLIHGSLSPPEPTPERHLDRFSRFCTAHRRASLYFITGALSSLKIAPFHCGIWTPNLTHDSLGPYEPKPMRHLDQFSRFGTTHRTVSIYFTIGRPFPLEIAPSHADLHPQLLIHDSLSQPELAVTQTESGSVQPFLQGSRL